MKTTLLYSLLSMFSIGSIWASEAPCTGTSGTYYVTACDSYTWIDGNVYTSTNKSATVTLIDQDGCDSLVTLSLIIINSTASVDEVTACESYYWIDGNQYTSDNNTATFTLPNKAGCDSVVHLNLTVNYADHYTEVVNTCDSYTWIDGNTYHSSTNSAQYLFQNKNECDSIITLNLTVNNVDASVTRNGLNLSSNTTGATYQWLDCANGMQPISGETNQTLDAKFKGDGDYAVVVTQNGCSDTSACFSINTVGIETVDFNGVHVFPNPTTGNFFIEFPNVQDHVSARITDLMGRTISTYELYKASKFEFHLEGPAGFYMIELITDQEQKQSFRIIKE